MHAFAVRRTQCSPDQSMETRKIVARYLNGTLVKGTTFDFNPEADMFHVQERSTTGHPTLVRMSDLKAVFYVKDFDGNPAHKDQHHFTQVIVPHGQRVEVTFQDGEIMAGVVPAFDRRQHGFFLFPADTESNNLRVFVVNNAVRYLRYL
jgi:hypothetical protein